ncbi:hypothetical protein AV530_005659 [Patagioenas fasciata monilis]|uniref:Uncharacterized protein n=1 Tax=Patagioenas fasciata monilis TaxID=372326 RepID=A0A1V4JM41_PATFA|nr:hypothetical protein AV530_005659 [Patagioenas fasciata monilis]
MQTRSGVGDFVSSPSSKRLYKDPFLLRVHQSLLIPEPSRIFRERETYFCRFSARCPVKNQTYCYVCRTN